jgi:hypothetical protein
MTVHASSKLAPTHTAAAVTADVSIDTSVLGTPSIGITVDPGIRVLIAHLLP